MLSCHVNMAHIKSYLLISIFKYMYESLYFAGII